MSLIVMSASDTWFYKKVTLLTDKFRSEMEHAAFSAYTNELRCAP